MHDKKAPEKPNGTSKKRKPDDNVKNSNSNLVLNSTNEPEPEFKKPKLPPPKRYDLNSSSSDDNVFKMPKLPERKRQPSKDDVKSIEIKAAVSEPPVIDETKTLKLKYSTGLEKNKIFIRNVDFSCTEEEIKVFFF